VQRARSNGRNERAQSDLVSSADPIQFCCDNKRSSKQIGSRPQLLQHLEVFEGHEVNTWFKATLNGYQKVLVHHRRIESDIEGSFDFSFDSFRLELRNFFED